MTKDSTQAPVTTDQNDTNALTTNQKYSKVFTYLLSLAQQGNSIAQYKIANHYNQGEGIEKNPEEAVKWFQIASDNGNTRAQYSLADCYHK